MQDIKTLINFLLVRDREKGVGGGGGWMCDDDGRCA